MYSFYHKTFVYLQSYAVSYLFYSKESASDSTTSYMHDMNIVLVTQLREEVESLKKTLAVKEKELLDKERKVGSILLPLLFLSMCVRPNNNM